MSHRKATICAGIPAGLGAQPGLPCPRATRQQPAPGIEGAAAWDEVFTCPGAGREPQPEMQSPEETRLDRSNLDLLGAKETEGNDQEELSR